MQKHNPQEYKEKSKDHFEKISSHYSDTYTGKYTEPMNDAVIQEFRREKFRDPIGCGMRNRFIFVNSFEQI